MSTQFDQDPFFHALMSNVSDEVYLIDMTSMRLVLASKKALDRFATNLAGLQEMGLKQLTGVDKQAFSNFAALYQETSNSTDRPEKISIKTEPPQSIELTLTLVRTNQQQYVMAVKPDSLNKRLSYKVFDESESRFQALVQHSPGLVFQLQLNDRKEISFVYLSDRCKALLGIDAEALMKSPQLFYAMMDKADRALLQECFEHSVQDMKMLNWEGRIWIDEWQDTKWVNMRATPRVLVDGMIQWEGIMTNITQSKNEKHELEESRKRLAELSAHLTRIKEEERHRIAREIHDDLGGNLTVIKIGLASILKRIPSDQEILIEKAKNLEAIVDATFDAAHRISGDLRPNVLELGIVAALEWQTKEFEKQMGIPSRFSTNQPEAKVTSEQAITLFRVCQESMSNIAKYAHASHVDVGLFFEPDSIRMLIHDDGVGIAVEDTLKPNSFGLRGMEERVVALKGQFSIGGAPGNGTNVSVMLPRHAGDVV